MTKESKRAPVPARRFPKFIGRALRETQFGDATAESTIRNGDKLPPTTVMGVTKADGIVPMEERIISTDIARYKIVQKDWFAYNPMRLNIGSIARWRGDTDILVSPDYVVFRCLDDPDSGAHPAYLDHFRQSSTWDAFVSEGGDGGVRVRIYYKDLACLRLALPPRDEQQKIADCLTSLDEVIAAQGRKVEALKTHKRGLMQQLFPRENETVPRLRFPEFRNGPGWEVGSLSSVCDMQAGKYLPATEITQEQHEGLYPCFGGNGLRGYTKTFTHFGRFPLLGRQGALCGNVQLASNFFYATEHAVVAKPKHDISTDYLYFMLVRLNLNRFATGQAQPGLSVEVLEKVACQTPSDVGEQVRIADSLTALDGTITHESGKLDTLNAHKKGLMQQLFPSPEEAL